jgi:hypothetical protein
VRSARFGILYSWSAVIDRSTATADGGERLHVNHGFDVPNVNAKFAVDQVHVTTLDSEAFIYEHHATCHIHTAGINACAAVLDR